jgi:pyruvate/2-oxoglutarate dehydrogenase complex dihydrolipoamide acyltransferase (E2) component
MADIKAAEGEVDATPAALAHAASLGVDLSKIVGTGRDGRITKTDVELAVGAKEEETPSGTSGSYYYCLEENHPGAPNFQTTPLSLTRIFQSDKEVPVCPACNKQTNAIPCEGPDIPPASILDLQERFGR